MTVEITASGAMPDWDGAARNFPFIKRRLLARMGLRAARSLYVEYLQGLLKPPAESKGLPLYRRGSRGVSYSVSRKGDAVTITSFPMNIYRAGPGKRDALRTIGKGLFRSFRSSFNFLLFVHVDGGYRERIVLHAFYLVYLRYALAA